jgi:hypothetical protein
MNSATQDLSLRYSEQDLPYEEFLEDFEFYTRVDEDADVFLNSPNRESEAKSAGRRPSQNIKSALLGLIGYAIPSFTTSGSNTVHGSPQHIDVQAGKQEPDSIQKGMWEFTKACIQISLALLLHRRKKEKTKGWQSEGALVTVPEHAQSHHSADGLNYQTNKAAVAGSESVTPRGSVQSFGLKLATKRVRY